jgi:hypothetical protein
MHWYQWVAIVLLALEAATGLRLRSQPVRNYYGWSRLGDAIVWSALLIYGGYFVS